MTRRHDIKRMWQKHVIAENRRSIPGLLVTLSAWPVYEGMATGGRLTFDMGTLRAQLRMAALAGNR